MSTYLDHQAWADLLDALDALAAEPGSGATGALDDRLAVLPAAQRRQARELTGLVARLRAVLRPVEPPVAFVRQLGAALAAYAPRPAGARAPRWRVPARLSRRRWVVAAVVGSLASLIGGVIAVALVRHERARARVA